MASRFYTPALAAIHQKLFEPMSLARSRTLVRLLRDYGVNEGMVVDLACGAGGWARELARHGYRAFGVDISPAMIRLARKRAPQARFVCASMTRTMLPPCDAVTGLGEPLNYLLRPAEVRRVLRNCRRALRTGGVLFFDTVEPPRSKRQVTRERTAKLGRYRMVAHITEDSRRRRIMRRITITAGRRVVAREVHRQRMYAGSELARWLRRAGFRASVMRDPRLVLSPRHCMVVARKR